MENKLKELVIEMALLKNNKAAMSIFNKTKDSWNSSEKYFLETLIKKDSKKIPNFIIKEQFKVKDWIMKNANSVITAPTSFGKTYILQKIILEHFSRKQKNTLIVCPTLSLNSEYFHSFWKEDVNATTSPIYNKNISVYILTPEKANILFKNEEIHFDLVIFDEFYEAFQESLRHYSFLDIYKKIIDIPKKVILLPGSVQLPVILEKDNFKLLEINKSATGRSHYSYVLETYDGKSYYSVYRKFDGIKKDKGKGWFYKEDVFINNSLKPKEIHFPKICEILESMNIDKIKSMIFVKLPNDMPKLCSDIIRLLRPKNRSGYWIKKILSYLENNMISTVLVECISKGIAYHNGKMDKYLRWLIEQAYKSGEIYLLIANSTLTKGVNLSPNNLFISSYDGMIKSSTSKIEAINAIGRVGRMKLDSIGNVFWFVKKGNTLEKASDIILTEKKLILDMPKIKEDKIPKTIHALYKVFIIKSQNGSLNIDFNENELKLIEKYASKNMNIRVGETNEFNNLVKLVVSQYNGIFRSGNINRISYYFQRNYMRSGFSKIYMEQFENNKTFNEKCQYDLNGTPIQDLDSYKRDRILFDIYEMYENEIGYYFNQVLRMIIDYLGAKEVLSEKIIKIYNDGILESEKIAQTNNWPDIFVNFFENKQATKEELDEMLEKAK